MASTTVPLIRASLVSTIEATEPTRLSDVPFRRINQSEDLQDTADGAPGSHLLRKFQIRQADSGVEGEIIHSTRILKEETFELMVAYPNLENIAGIGGLDGLRDMMREDHRSLRDRLFSPDLYLSGVQRQGPGTSNFEENEDVWWLVMSLPVLFYEAQTLYTIPA
jgi:hypothetical protein